MNGMEPLTFVLFIVVRIIIVDERDLSNCFYRS